mgnify:CR=1 FL=1
MCRITFYCTNVLQAALANLMADSVNLFKPPVWIDQNIKKAVEEKGTASSVNHSKVPLRCTKH